MATCPVGHEIESAFGSLLCNGCGRQCIIKQLLNKTKELEGELNKIKRSGK